MQAHWPLLSLSLSILRLLLLLLLLARETNCYEGSSGRIDRRSMYACIVVVPDVSLFCTPSACTHTHTHALTQLSNTQRLIYQSSYVYVCMCVERERKSKAHIYKHIHAHTHIHPLHYLKQRCISVRPSTAKSKRRKKEEERR